MLQFPFTLETFEFFLIILVRITTFMYTAPFYSQDATPDMVKIAFSVFISGMVFVSLPDAQLNYIGVLGYTTIVLKEGITGLLIGFAANICNSIVLFTGRLIDMEIGLSMANALDPTTKEQSSITGTLYNNAIMMLLIISDMHIFIMRTAIDSFSVIPVGQTIFDYENLVSAMVGFLTDYMVIAFRILLPYFICIMMLNVVLGIMAKVAPQMNMFSVGMQLKVITGFLVMFMVIALLPNVANFIFIEMKKMMVQFMETMY